MRRRARPAARSAASRSSPCSGSRCCSTVIAQRLRVQHAQRGARRAQRDVARAGARRGRRRGRAHGVRAVAAAQPARRLAWPTASRTRGTTATSRSTATRGRRSRAHRPQHGARAAAEGPAAERRRARSGRRRSASLDAILDWRDADDLQRPNGAEAPDYRAAGLEVRARPTRRSRRVGELQRVLGVTPALDRAHRRQPHRLFAAARHQPGDRVARRAARAARRRRRSRSTRSSPQRADALANKLPVPPFPPAQGFAPARRRCGASAPRRRRPMV